MGSQAVHKGKINKNNAREVIRQVQSDAANILKMIISAEDKINPLDIALGKPLHQLE
jgi:hypothetical protein